MKKKGFTLIELLAVIVILAIIALIATPMVLNTIDEAKKGSAKSSAYSYVNGVETALASYMLKNNGVSYEARKYDVKELDADDKLEIALKGDTPSEGKVCIASNGIVTKASLKINGYIVNYDGKETSISDSNTVEDITCEGITTVTYQEYYTGTKTQVSTIYYNPVDNIKCTETDYNNNSDKLGKTGCLKWYAIENSDSTKSAVDVILDHNTTAKVAWNLSGNTTDGMGEVQTELDNLKSVSAWKVTPRLITADELASITGAKDTFAWDSSKPYAETPELPTTISHFYLNGAEGSDATWQTQISTSQGANTYSWLFDYTNGCTSNGCDVEDSSTYGYWTSTPITGKDNYIWGMDSRSLLGIHELDYAGYGGVRPVITISKGILQ